MLTNSGTLSLDHFHSKNVQSRVQFEALACKTLFLADGFY
jgi:hypothetical protein